MKTKNEKEHNTFIVFEIYIVVQKALKSQEKTFSIRIKDRVTQKSSRDSKL